MSRVHLTLDGKPPYHAIGLISGTSHDGISAAVVAINDRQSPPLRLLAFKAFPYRKDLRARLLAASAGAGGRRHLVSPATTWSPPSRRGPRARSATPAAASSCRWGELIS
ncbi:MAG TPA: anhydro-N-acetylmuramic acid kinase [Candidatus Binataceae bacterium]|nr:anhydro-N-acetylmuramic acid kinase [Candidatus Binataceae bacterium]